MKKTKCLIAVFFLLSTVLTRANLSGVPNGGTENFFIVRFVNHGSITSVVRINSGSYSYSQQRISDGATFPSSGSLEAGIAYVAAGSTTTILNADAGTLGVGRIVESICTVNFDYGPDSLSLTNHSTTSVSGTGYWDIDLSGEIVPEYTNYTFRISNNLSNIALAVWKFNGSIVKQKLLMVGETDTWTTPNLETSPFAQNFTASTELSLPQSQIFYNNNGDGSFLPSIGNTTVGQNYSGIAGGSGTVTGTGGGGGVGGGTSGGSIGATNTLSATGGSVPTATNSYFNFSNPQGLASESTLAGGFNGLASQNAALLSGLGSIDNDIRGGNAALYLVTNLLGQIALYAKTNSDSVPTFVRYLTNLNNVPLISSNLQHIAELPANTNALTTASNVWVMNFPTNNPFPLTNVSTETTLQKILNLFTDTNGAQGMVASSMMAMSNQYMEKIDLSGDSVLAKAASGQSVALASIDSLKAELGTVNSGGDTPEGVEPEAQVTASTSLGAFTFNIKPTTGPFKQAFDTLHDLSTYILVLLYAARIFVLVIRFIEWLTKPMGRGVPDMEAGGQALTFGLSGNAIGVTVWFLLIAVVMFIWAAALAIIFTYIYNGFQWSTMINAATSNPLRHIDAGAMGFLLAAFPVRFALALVSAYLVFLATIAGVKLLVGGAQQWIPRG